MGITGKALFLDRSKTALGPKLEDPHVSVAVYNYAVHCHCHMQTMPGCIRQQMHIADTL